MTEKKAKEELRQRIRMVLLFLGLVFVVIVGRLWYLQIIRGEEFLRRSEANALRVIPIPAPRGIIYDRNLTPLATNRQAFTVSIVPRDLPDDPEPVYRRLSKIIDMSPEEIADAVASGQRLPYYPVRLVRDVGPEVVTTIEESRIDLPGVIIEETPIRYYPFGPLAGHTLGYLGQISEEQLKELGDQGYTGSDIVGRTGLERVYESELRGIDGGQQVEVNRVNRPIRVLGKVESIPGNNLVLTLDAGLQGKVEELLAQRLAEIREEGRYPRAYAGAAVVLDPNSGQILAMASEPGFDPSQFVGGVSFEYWQELVNNPYNPLRNRVTQGDITPGSVFKVVTAYAALSENLTSPWEVFDAQGRDYVYPQKTCWIYAQGRTHGRETVAEAIGDSCNVVFYELGRRVGIDKLSEYARRLGLGEPTGLNLYPPESSGLVPSREWKREAFQRPDQKIWYPIETLDVSIGQGPILVTPLQMALVYSVLANGGTLYKPYLVQAILKPTGEVVKTFKPVIKDKLEIKPRVLETIREGLRYTITQGTGRSAFEGFPIPVAGKSGTAELSKTTSDVHGWFACYAPADDPEVVVVVALERAGGGGSSAGPVARKILEYYFGLDPSQSQEELAEENGVEIEQP
ncbi:MAG: penicillin-binding protein 2 [Firmicutes bacterium]|nr:penicillin-binding protein 2 [Bacillota bacterium]